MKLLIGLELIILFSFIHEGYTGKMFVQDGYIQRSDMSPNDRGFWDSIKININVDVNEIIDDIIAAIDKDSVICSEEDSILLWLDNYCLSETVGKEHTCLNRYIL